MPTISWKFNSDACNKEVAKYRSESCLEKMESHSGHLGSDVKWSRGVHRKVLC
jgi:hypothetical protein